jgi:hypothetical protein
MTVRSVGGRGRSYLMPIAAVTARTVILLAIATFLVLVLLPAALVAVVS